MALCPSGQGVGLELRWALPAQVRTLSVSFSCFEEVVLVPCRARGKFCASTTANATAWPSGLRRQLKALVRKGVGSNPTAVILLSFYDDDRGRNWDLDQRKHLNWGFGAVGSA